MSCRVGMSTDPQERIEYWKNKEGCTSGRVLHSKLTYDRALELEKKEATERGCHHSSGGPRVAGQVWSVYYLSGCK